MKKCVRVGEENVEGYDGISLIDEPVFTGGGDLKAALELLFAFYKSGVICSCGHSTDKHLVPARFGKKIVPKYFQQSNCKYGGCSCLGFQQATNIDYILIEEHITALFNKWDAMDKTNELG